MARGKAKVKVRSYRGDRDPRVSASTFVGPRVSAAARAARAGDRSRGKRVSGGGLRLGSDNKVRVRGGGGG